MPVGLHVSIAGGLVLAIQRAEELGCDTLQIFSRNPRGWVARDIETKETKAFREGLKNSGISPLIIHTSYLINLATPDERVYTRSVDAIKEDIKRAEQLGADFLVTHIGSTKGRDVGFGINRVIRALKSILNDGISRGLKILLENSSGSGFHLGHTLEELAKLISPFKETDSLGFCLDTCHAFSAGYPLHTRRDIDSLVKAIDKLIGIEYLLLLHLNDSKGGLGSRIDYHEHIGKGKIGLKGFRALVLHPALKDIPMILETPKRGIEDDLRNIGITKGLIQ